VVRDVDVTCTVTCELIWSGDQNRKFMIIMGPKVIFCKLKGQDRKFVKVIVQKIQYSQFFKDTKIEI
jgi:hypothetical protein